MHIDDEAFVSNPLNAFLLIKRLSLDANQIAQFVYNAAESFLNRMETLTLGSEEMQGVVEAIDRLQTTYNLKTEDLANGIIDSDSYNMTLSAHDLFSIGFELQKSEKSSRAIEYFTAALRKNQKVEGFNEVSDEEILTELMVAYDKTGNFEKAITAINDLLLFDPANLDVETLLSLKETFQESLNLGIEEKFDEPQESLEEELTRKVCNGKLKRNLKELSQLYCRYESKNVLSKLARFKLEEVHIDPLIVVYHDVISENEIEVLKDLARDRLKREIEGDFEEFRDFTLKVAWFEDDEHEVIARISKRVEVMTGLKASNAGDLQIRQYGIGGFSQLEDDFDDLENANRVATVLVYVSKLFD